MSNIKIEGLDAQESGTTHLHSHTTYVDELGSPTPTTDLSELRDGSEDENTECYLPEVRSPACGVCSQFGHRYWAGSQCDTYWPCERCPRNLTDTPGTQGTAPRTSPSYATVPPDQHIFPALRFACEVCTSDGPICRCGAHWRTHIGALMWQCQREYLCKGTRFYHEACLQSNEKRPRITNEGIICNECYLMRNEVDDDPDCDMLEEGIEGMKGFAPQSMT